MQSGAGAFDVGRRNALAARKLLWKQQARLVAEDVGGHAARTAVLDVATGDLTVRKPGQAPRKLR